MFNYMDYGPYICIAVVIFILFLLWLFFGGKNYEFIGLDPLRPDDYISTNKFSEKISANDSGDDENIICINNIDEDDNIEERQNTNENNHYNLYEDQQYNDSFNQPEQLDELNICLNPEIIKQYQELDDAPPHSVCLNPIDVNKKETKGRFLSKGEKICCETMEKIYGVPFKSIRPNWLSNPETGRNLELDCYNDDLKIGVEYNGIQHYEWPNFTNQSEEEFINQVRRDDLKKKLCDRNGVYLIVVPYKVNHKDIPKFLTAHLPENIQKRLYQENTLSDIF